MICPIPQKQEDTQSFNRCSKLTLEMVDQSIERANVKAEVQVGKAAKTATEGEVRYVARTMQGKRECSAKRDGFTLSSYTSAYFTNVFEDQEG